MCAAAVCAVHCIATPLIVGILPVIGLPLLDPRTEWLLLSVSLTVSSVALFSGCVRDRRWVPVWSFALGAGLCWPRASSSKTTAWQSSQLSQWAPCSSLARIF
jgi:MerC mercury resistance protein